MINWMTMVLHPLYAYKTLIHVSLAIFFGLLVIELLLSL